MIRADFWWEDAISFSSGQATINAALPKDHGPHREVGFLAKPPSKVKQQQKAKKKGK